MSFGNWVCFLELDLNEQETADLVRGLHQRLGKRVRTTTKERWLHDAERAPVAPFGKPMYSGTIRQVKVRRGVGARATQ